MIKSLIPQYIHAWDMLSYSFSHEDNKILYRTFMIWFNCVLPILHFQNQSIKNVHFEKELYWLVSGPGEIFFSNNNIR